MKNSLILASLLLLAAKPVLAHDKEKDVGPACKEIAEACKKAGFAKGEWKKGTGLWRDCVNPIVQGEAAAAGATKPLPTVDAKVVSDCKASNPKFGEGKVGAK